jgi:hypothetical protein
MTDEGRQARRRRKALAAMRALATHGTFKAAAAHLGVHEATVRRQIADYLRLYEYETPIQAVYALDRQESALNHA